jgi:hypothetical protein
MRRLIRQYGRAANAVFPTGVYPRGGNYGNDVNFPVPDQEKQNPNYSAGITCIDRDTSADGRTEGREGRDGRPPLAFPARPRGTTGCPRDRPG